MSTDRRRGGYPCYKHPGRTHKSQQAFQNCCGGKNYSGGSAFPPSRHPLERKPFPPRRRDGAARPNPDPAQKPKAQEPNQGCAVALVSVIAIVLLLVIIALAVAM